MLRVPVKLIGTLASTNHRYIARNFFPTARAVIALRGHMTYILFPPRETLRFSGNKMNCFQVKVTFTPKGERELVPRDQVSHELSLAVYYFYTKISSFTQRNCSGQFLCGYFLFWEILNLNLTFAVGRWRDSQSLWWDSLIKIDSVMFKTAV